MVRSVRCAQHLGGPLGRAPGREQAEGTATQRADERDQLLGGGVGQARLRRPRQVRRDVEDALPRIVERRARRRGSSTTEPWSGPRWMVSRRRPSERATVSKRPPSASVADVATTVRSVNRCVDSVPRPTSGATTTARRRSLDLDPGDVVRGLLQQPLRGLRQLVQRGARLLLANRVGVVDLDLADRFERPAGGRVEQGQRLAQSVRGRPVVRRPGTASPRPIASASPASMSRS